MHEYHHAPHQTSTVCPHPAAVTPCRLSRSSLPYLPLCVVRGAGDLATGVISTLIRAGLPCIALETACPTVIRRTVSFADALYRKDRRCVVEGLRASVVDSYDQACSMAYESAQREWEQRELPILIDPLLEQTLQGAHQPDILIDAILAKRNKGTQLIHAPLVIALGPGFEAGKDCHAVIETMRGHDLGRIITHGSALPNTGVPGEVGGVAADRVVHAPCAGQITSQLNIGDYVHKGDVIACINPTDPSLTSPFVVYAPISGVIRGMLAPACRLSQGLKMADIDPRPQAVEYCHSISDKARALGGSVFTAISMLYPAQHKAVGD